MNAGSIILDRFKLRKLRDKKQVTLREVSSNLDFSVGELCKIECGKRNNPNIETVLQLAKYYEVEIKDILTDKVINKYL